VRSIKLRSWTERLLGATPLPSPPHVFLLEETRLRYAQVARERHALRLRVYREVELPRDAFASGLLGGPLRDAAGFAERLSMLVSAVPGGVHEASLVVPDAWLRVTFAESGELPRATAALDEVLRWKLRRLVPFRVDELRIGATEVEPLPGQEEPRRLLMGFAIDQLLSQLEEAFAAVDVRIGQISNFSLSLLDAVTPVGSGDFTALASVDEDGYTLVFARGGEPVLHRYKAFTGTLPEAARGGFVERDLKLTRNFLDEQYPGAALAKVLVSAPPGLETIWVERLRQGLGEEAAPLDEWHLPTLRGEDGPLPPWRTLAPLIGAAMRDVA
jgi:hypothetical protein